MLSLLASGTVKWFDEENGHGLITAEDGKLVMTAESVTATSPHASSEFRCARCGYGIIVSGALPACPMCRTTNWDSTRYQEGRRSGDDSRHENPRS